MKSYQSVTPTQASQPSVYDSRCEDITVAVRSLFKLARTLRWRDCFARLGLDKEERDTLFQLSLYYGSEMPHQEDVPTLTKAYPWIDQAAKQLVKMYVQATAPERYGKVSVQYA